MALIIAWEESLNEVFSLTVGNPSSGIVAIQRSLPRTCLFLRARFDRVEFPLV
jgi:hypothetical protein